jgi:hypothetical protein
MVDELENQVLESFIEIVSWPDTQDISMKLSGT